MSFDKKTIVVTGGGSGIGARIVEDLYIAGANVCFVGRSQNKLAETREAILGRSCGVGSLLCYPCDVSLPTQVKELFQQLADDGYSVSGLVNNAGVNPSRNNIENTSFEDWQKTLDVNLSGAFNCTKEAATQMIGVGGGSIVNIGSIAAINALPQRTSYMTSKWGLLGLSQSVALDYASKNIRINCVCPGYVKTPLVTDYLEGLPRAEYEALVNAHPMKKLGQPEDISNATLFLLSEQAAWITGAILPVDGGYSLGKEY